MALTLRQESVFNFIKDYINEKHNSPTVREICKNLDIKSTSTVSNDINVLIDLGYIYKEDNKSRSIILADKYRNINSSIESSTIDVPILGNVAAGQPIYAEENIDDYFPIPANLGKKGNLFMLKVKGESMIEVGIFDGDKVLVRQQNTCDNGDIIVALIEDGATVKTFKRENGKVLLIPENSSMDPIVPDHCDILGKVIALYRDL